MKINPFFKSLIVSGVFLSFYTSLQAQSYNGVIKSSYMSVRKEAKFNSVIVAKKMRGDVYRVIFEDKNWIKVQFADGVTGWLFKTVTNRSDEDFQTENETASSTSDLNVKAKKKNGLADLPDDDGYEDEKVSNKPVSSDGKNNKQKNSNTGKTTETTASKNTKSSQAIDNKNSKISKDKVIDNSDKSNKSDKNTKNNDNSSSVSNKSTNSNSEKTDSSSNQSSQKAVAEISSNAEDLYNEAIALYAKRMYEEALEKNMLASKKAPKNAEIMNNIGNCLFKLGKEDKALDYWKKALKLAPKSGKICNNIGIAYYQMNKTKDAIAYYKKAILFEPDYADTYYNIASAYGYTGDFDNASKNFQSYIDKTENEDLKKLAKDRLDYCEKQMKK